MSLDPKIQEMLSQLEAALRTTAYGKDGAPSLMGKNILVYINKY